MLQTLATDQLKDVSYQYVHEIKHHLMSMDFSLFKILKDKLEIHVQSFVITNYFIKNKIKPWYALKCDRNTLEYLEFCSFTTNHFFYNFQTDELTKGQVMLSKVLKTQFKRRVSQCFVDISKESAQLFEEHI